MGKTISRKVFSIPDQNGDGRRDRRVRERVTHHSKSIQCSATDGCEKKGNKCTCTTEYVEYRQRNGKFDHREPAYRGKNIWFKGKEYFVRQMNKDTWKDGKNLRDSRLLLKPIQKDNKQGPHPLLIITKYAFERQLKKK